MDPLTICCFVFVGLFGLAVGSFLNVVIYRIPKRNFFSSTSSYCPHCHTKLKWFELIPVFSWIFLGGKCRTCKAKISIRYPLVEISNTALWLLAYAFHGLQVQTILYMIACSVLLVIAFIDTDTGSVPAGLSLTATLIGVISLICSAFIPNGILWWEHLVGGGAMGGILFLTAFVTKERAVDRHDAEVMLGLGLMIGWKLGLVALLFGSIAFGVTFAIRHVRADRTGEKRDIPLCPAIAVGAFCAILFGGLLLEHLFPL